MYIYIFICIHRPFAFPLVFGLTVKSFHLWDCAVQGWALEAWEQCRCLGLCRPFRSRWKKYGLHRLVWSMRHQLSSDTLTLHPPLKTRQSKQSRLIRDQCQCWLKNKESCDSSTHSGQEMNLDESQCLSKRATEGSQCFAALKLSVSCDQVKQ